VTEEEQHEILIDALSMEMARGGVVESFGTFSAIVHRGRKRRMLLVDDTGRIEVHAWTSPNQVMPKVIGALVVGLVVFFVVYFAVYAFG
jgi:hypothetical protein